MTAKRELKYREVAFAPEATEGTDPTGGTPSDWYRLLGDNHAINPKRLWLPDESVGGTHERPAGQSIGTHNEVQIPMYLFGKESTAGDPALQAALFGAMGFDETITASTSAAYELVTFHTMAVAPTITVYERRRYSDGQYRQVKSHAVRGNGTFTFEMEKYALVEMPDGRGPYQEVPTGTTAGTPPAFGSYNGGKRPLKVVSMVAEVDSTARKLTKCDFNTGWDVTLDKDTSGATSTQQVELSRSSAPTGSFESADIDLFDDVLTAQATDEVIPIEITLTDSTDTVVVAMDVQFGQYNRTGGPIGKFSFPFTVVGNITITFT